MFICTICNREFSKKASMYSHIGWHTFPKRKQNIEAVENLRKRSIGNKHRVGCIMPESAKEAIREYQKKKIVSPTTRQKLSKALSGNKYWLGKKHSMNTRKKLSLSKIGDNNPTKNPAVREKIRGTLKNRKLSIEHRQNISKGLNNIKPLMIDNSIKLWRNDDYVKKQMTSRNLKPNNKEWLLEKLLFRLYPNEWRFVGDGQVIIAGKCPDFINVNGKKLIIELFGDYWHRGQNPEDRISIFKPYGYETLIIWEKELKDIPAIEQKIRRFANV